MKKEFWLERWEREEIGFHEGAVNAYLNQYWRELNIAQGNMVFVPLCGKSVDMQWLREQGHALLGVEFSKVAAQGFFQEHGYIPQHETHGKFDSYEANGIRILCGDFFDLSREHLADAKAVYDRASMVALPPEMRGHYVKHLLEILPPDAKILLVTLDYPQAEMQGPPFSVSSAEIAALYGEHAEIRLLGQIDALPQNPRFQKKGLTRLQESIYLLTPRQAQARIPAPISEG